MLVVHIGTHKTGTSALQQVLARTVDKLAACGVNYVAAGRDNRIAHHPLAWALRGRRKMGFEVWDAAHAEIASNAAPIQLISSEAFWYEDPVDVKRQLGYKGEIKIVAYLRRQDAFLQSLYKQAVTSGRKTDFTAWLEEKDHRGDYLAVIDAWAAAFGREAIVLRPYERDGATVDIIDDFFPLIGLDGTEIAGELKRRSYNPSPRRELLYLLRAFNNLNLKVDHDKLFYSVIGRKKDYVRTADLLSYEECVALLARYEESNRMLAERYWKGSGPLFGVPVKREPPRMWGLDDPEFFELAVDVFDAVVKLVAPEGEGTGAVVKKRKFNAPAP